LILVVLIRRCPAEHKKYRVPVLTFVILGVAALAVYRAPIGGGRLLSLRGEDLRNLDLKEKDLSLADLSGARMDGSDLRFASLIGSDLREARFANADLHEANLAGADIRGADFSEAKGLELTAFDAACVDKTTRLPEDVRSNLPPGTNEDSCYDPEIVAGFARVRGNVSSSEKLDILNKVIGEHRRRQSPESPPLGK
jgi:hypothetical protein